MSPLLKNNPAKKSNTLRNYCLASGVIALAVMLFTYICHSNSILFGDNTVLRMDLYHQYGPLYSELYDRIVNGYSLVYSWTSGLGGSFLGNLFNYCCSPFALIMLLFGHKNMPEAIAVMIMLKAVASSMTFTYYINKSNKTVNKASIAFGLCYAFCSYFVAYSWNIMWIDAMSVFPLVILGIEYIIQYKKPSLFIFALTYTMITNYYMAYMVCILAVIYFLYYFFGRYELSSSLSGKKEPAPAVAEPEEFAPNPDMAADSLLGSSYEATMSAADLNAEELPFEGTDEEYAEPTVGDDEALNEEPSPDSEDITLPEADEKGDSGFSFMPEALSEPPQTYAVKKHGKFGKNKKEKKEKQQHRLRDNRFWVTGWTFALAALLCFIVSAFALFPVYYCLQTSSATSASFPNDIKTYFNIFDFAANHLPSVAPTIRSSGSDVLPNVYCGLLTLMLIPFYFLSNKISGRKKVMAAVIIGLFYAGFAVNYFNFVWHGFHFPNDLPYRYSFAYSFILLTLAFKAIENISEISRKAFVILGMITVGAAVLLSEIGSKNVDSYTITITILFAVLYVIVFGMMTSKNYAKKTVVSLLIFTVVVELCFANTPKYVMSQPKSNYTGDYTSYQEISDLVDSNDNDLFYRTELSKLRTRMDPCWYGYNGVSTFSSMAYEHVAKLMESMGMFGNNINSYTYYPQTPIFNSMFALKYIYDNEDLINNDDFYTSVASNDNFEAFRYKYYLPLAVSVSEDILNWSIASSNPFEVQNNLMQTAAGVDEILTNVDAAEITVNNLKNITIESVNSSGSFRVEKITENENATATVVIKVEEAGDYYLYMGSTSLSNLKITAENFEYSYASSSIQPFTINVGKQSAGAEIKIVFTVPEDNSSANITFRAVKCDLTKFDAAYKTIEKNGTLEIIEFNESSFTGKVNVTNDNALIYTSIPYDESWQITVDGQVLEYAAEDATDTEGKLCKVGNALIGIDLEKGSHTISFKYEAKGLKTGILATCFGIAVVVILLLFKFVFSKKLAEKGKRTTIFNDPENNVI